MLKRIVFAGLLPLLFISSVSARDCEDNNVQLRAMTESIVTFSKADGETIEFLVKTADNNVTRAAGFQRVCESTIEAQPILFLFNRKQSPSFHMNNVVAPIDIAFIDEDGKIDSIQSMAPYSLVLKHRPRYSPHQPVIAALETHKGFYTKHQIDLTTTVSWKRVPPPKSKQP